MKNNFNLYQGELEKLIDERMINNIDKNKEFRINEFIHGLELDREKKKFNDRFKNQKLGFSSPLIFTMNNFYCKKKDLLFDNNKSEKMYNRTIYNTKNNKI